MSNQNNTPKPNALYRYHPEYGYVEVIENTQDNVGQNMAQIQNLYQNIPPYCPPFMPHYAHQMMHYNYLQEMQKMYEEQNKKNLETQQVKQEPEQQQEGLTEEKIREIYTVVNDAVNGNPDPQKMFSLFKNTPGDFWKGLAIGAGAVLLFNYSPLKNMVASMMGNSMQNQDEEFCEECENEQLNTNK